MGALARDIRYAARQLGRTPGFTVVAVLMLALGIAVNTTMFAAVNAMILNPRRVANLDNVFIPRVTNRMTRTVSPNLSRDEFRRLEAHPPDAVIAMTAVMKQAVVAVTDSGQAENVEAELVTGGHAAVFRLTPQAGRLIGPDDDTDVASPVVVISDRLWRNWFGADPAIVGRVSLKIDNARHVVIGVAPRGYRGIWWENDASDVWLAVEKRPNQVLGPTGKPYSLWYFSTTFVRARPNAPRGALEQPLLTRLSDTQSQGGRLAVRVTPAADAMRQFSLVQPALAVLAFTGLVLLAACANLTNMLYARGTERAGEVAVRLALGASPLQIFRLFLSEVGIIAALAAALAMLLGLSATYLIAIAVPTIRARMGVMALDVAWDYRVFVYPLAAGAVSAMLIGLATAWRSTRASPPRTLAAAGAVSGLTARRGGVRSGLVALQVTAALILVMGAGIFLTITAGAMDRRIHFDTEHLVSGRIDLQFHGYSEDRARTFLERLVHEAGRIPGVERAAVADGLPEGAYSTTESALIVAADPPGGRSGQPRSVGGRFAGVSPGFVQVIGLPLRRGRDITAGDRDGAPLVAVVSESVAGSLWPGQDPIGQRLDFGNLQRWRTVVGVMADPVSSLEATSISPANFVVIPAEQRYRPEMLILVRSATPAAVVDPLRGLIRTLDPDVAVFDLGTAAESILAAAAPLRATRLLIASLGALALGIATLGVYGVVSYFVSLRTREFGIRMALGATRRQVIKIVIDEAVHVLLIGLLVGVLVVSVGERVLSSQIVRLMPNDIANWIMGPLVILLTGLAASYIPARRASRVDPNVALRQL